MELKEVFYTNLLLLGFNAESHQAKLGIPINSDMFLHPNKKAMEVVLHFLFSCLDPPLALQEFRDCWPVVNKKAEQDFRRSCKSWLTRIAKEEPDCNLPTIGATLFLSPGGKRFYEVMLYFSSYVLRKVLLRRQGKDTAMPCSSKKISRMPNMTGLSNNATLATILVEKGRFFQQVQNNVEVQQHWKSYAVSSAKEYRDLCKEQRSLEKKLSPFARHSHSRENTLHVEKAEAVQRTKQLLEVRQCWSALTSFYEETMEKRQILTEIMENREPKYILDGSAVDLQIPDVLTTKYRDVIQMTDIKNTYEGGKLNVLSLVQLSKLALRMVKEKIKQDGSPDFEPYIPIVKHEARSHGSYLSRARALRSTLSNEFIPELKKSIDELREECYSYSEAISHNSFVALDSYEFGLGLVPTTPSPVLKTSGDLTPSSDNQFSRFSLKKTPKIQATPDMIENLTTSIREMALRNDDSSPAKETNTSSAKDTVPSKVFTSKIPKPVDRQLSKTPDGKREKSTVVRRRSLSTAKKIKRKRYSLDNENITDSKNTSDHRSTEQYMESSDFLNLRARVEQLKTPLGSGHKFDSREHHFSARNILAERIADAVFSDVPSTYSGSQSSSRSNSFKDVALADPLGNLTEEAFASQDLIPRTPFKQQDMHASVTEQSCSWNLDRLSRSQVLTPTKELQSPKQAVGNLANSCLTSPRILSPVQQENSLLCGGNTPQYKEMEQSHGHAVSDSVVRNHPRMSEFKDFLTQLSPMSNGNQTPLENTRPPTDLNRNCVDSIKPRLSFDLGTPAGEMPAAKEFFLEISSSEETVTGREFELIPINVDELFKDDDQLLLVTKDGRDGKTL